MSTPAPNTPHRTPHTAPRRRQDAPLAPTLHHASSPNSSSASSKQNLGNRQMDNKRITSTRNSCLAHSPKHLT